MGGMDTGKQTPRQSSMNVREAGQGGPQATRNRDGFFMTQPDATVGASGFQSQPVGGAMAPRTGA